MGKEVLSALASSGLNAAGSVATGLLQQAFYKKNLKAQTQAQKDLMDYQNNINQSNLVKEQSLRKQSLREAGLSTASIDGSSAGLVGQSMPSSPSSFAPSFDMSSLGSAGASAMLMASQARKNNADARGQEITNNYQDEMIQKTISQLDENIGYIRSQKDLSDTTRERAIADLEYYKKAYPEMLTQIGLSNQELDQRINNLNIQYHLSKQQYDFNSESMPLQIKMTIAQISLLRKQGELTDAQAKQCFATVGELNQLARLYGSQANVNEMTESAQIARAIAEKGKAEGEQIRVYDLAEQTSREVEDMRRHQGKFKDMSSPIERYDWCIYQLGKFSSAFGPVGGAVGGYLMGKGKASSAAKPAAVTPTAPTPAGL